MTDTCTAPLKGEIIPLTERMAGPLVAFDPRQNLDEGALIEASRTAYPAVAARPSRKDGMGLAAGGAVALSLGAATFWGMSGGREAEAPRTAVPVAAAPAAPPAPAVAPPTPEQAAAIAAAGQPVPASGPVFTSTPAPVPLGGPVPVPGSGPSPMSERLRSPTLVVDTSGPVVPLDVAAAPGAPAAVRPSPQSSIAFDPFAARGDASAADTARATAMKDPGRTVSQGTLIPAVLETAINSDLPGYVRAVVSQDVRSFDGSRVLIPRSSRLIGQYKSGLAAGQTRAYVLWSRLIRPDGVSVAIASPGTDESGRTGLAGEVDSHFFKRFGSAMLLSVVGAASAIGSGGSSLVMSGGASAAGVAAQQNGAIPPTIRVRQGQPIRVFTARDLDFSQVAAGAR